MSYLAEVFSEKGYNVQGIKGSASSFKTTRIDHLYQDQIPTKLVSMASHLASPFTTETLPIEPI
ncbi:hypothetical protein SynBIOSU31_00247 [Synechococcus sp. BIOS-U3-1]|nr:hypothetical protein SynBIOSU31_00247 [Synechococcus sp. BIOS-U3-1]